MSIEDGKWYGRRLGGNPPPGGWPRYGYTRQLPEGISIPRVFNEDRHLPGSLALDGWQLLRIEEFSKSYPDPFVLYNPWGEIVAQWETLPSLGTLMEFVPRGQLVWQPIKAV